MPALACFDGALRDAHAKTTQGFIENRMKTVQNALVFIENRWGGLGNNKSYIPSIVLTVFNVSPRISNGFQTIFKVSSARLATPLGKGVVTCSLGAMVASDSLALAALPISAASPAGGYWAWLCCAHASPAGTGPGPIARTRVASFIRKIRSPDPMPCAMRTTRRKT